MSENPDVAGMTETVELLRQQAVGCDPAGQADLAGALEQLGLVLFRDGRSAEALAHLAGAVEKRQALAGNGTEESLASLAVSIELLRDCRQEAGSGPDAVLAAAQEALAVRYRLAVADPARYAASMSDAALYAESRVRSAVTLQARLGRQRRRAGGWHPPTWQSGRRAQARTPGQSGRIWPGNWPNLVPGS